MPSLPSDSWPDSTLAFLLDPYKFISKRCRRYNSDLFQARLRLRKTICMTGPKTAELFYDGSRFIRTGVAPNWLKKTLFGKGGVQGLDGDAHRQRKQMFMSLMTPDRIERLGTIAAKWWQTYAQKWSGMQRVVLYDEVNEILSRTVCEWAGIPLADSEVHRRTRELMAMFDRAGTVGLGHVWSRLARRRAERWIGDLIEDIRAGRFKPPKESAAWIVAMHRDLGGQLLSRHTAAVELINVLRPTVAVSVFITFSALALHEYPSCRQRLAGEEAHYADFFAQEVRRFYPFFPIVMAQVSRDFEWNGFHFPKGRLVVLDLYGTNHDERSWKEPHIFQPERFHHWNENAFNFVPQGGGNPQSGHRCPGELIANELIKVSSHFLAKKLIYEIPKQDLRIDFARLPALPRSRFIISSVRQSGAAHNE